MESVIVPALTARFPQLKVELVQKNAIAALVVAVTAGQPPSIAYMGAAQVVTAVRGDLAVTLDVHLYAHNTKLNWIVRLPDGHPHQDQARNRTIEAFVQNHDIVPTALDLVGLLDKWPGAEHELGTDQPLWAGRSMRGLIEGTTAASGRDHVVTGWGDMASVRDRDFNYVVQFENPAGTERVCDLRTDPLELKNVVGDHPAVVREGRRRLEALLGQELGTRLPDAPLQETVTPCRLYFGARPATRHEQASGFV